MPSSLRARFSLVLPALLAAVTACETMPPAGSDASATGPDGGPATNACSYVPASCVELLPSDSATAAGPLAVKTLPQPVAGCFVVRQPGRYVHDYINIVDGGALYFEEAAAGDIDFRAHSILVEKGGLIQAGSASCPFGAHGHKLSIGLYGDDPTQQGTVTPAASAHGVECETNKDGGMHRCLPASMQHDQSYYCTVGDSSDPCSATMPPTPVDAKDALVNGSSGKNYLLEPYHALNFDDAPFGYKVLAVSYGGAIRFFGDKGTRGAAAVEGNGSCRVPSAAQSTLDADEMRAWAGLSGSSWTRLDGQEDKDDRSVLTLDRRVDEWREGDDIVVAPTDWYPGHHEVRTILKVTQPAEPTGKTRLEVQRLAYPHVAKIFDTGDIEAQGGEFTAKPRRKAADLRAPVGLLSRSIQIRSLGKTAADEFPSAEACMAGANDPSCYFGGHLVFRQGFREVQLQGVELKQLGQGGRMGHYPVHFHLAKSTKYTGGKTFLRDSSIWDSMTRFVVLHGSHDIDLSRNVGFLSVGHGFYGEDASEIDNRLCHNLGIGARAAMDEFYDAQKQQFAAQKAKDASAVAPPTVRAIPPILDGVNDGRDGAGNLMRGGPVKQRMGSDGLMPVMYWMMNAYNEQVGNLAAGVYGFGSCFWLLGSGLSGASQDHQLDGLAAYNGTGTQQAPLLRFRGNGCSTAAHALPASVELPPSVPGTLVGYTQTKNPYLYKSDGLTPKSPSELKDADGMFLYERPVVTGNFRPIQLGANQGNCAGATSIKPDGSEDPPLDVNNVSACAMTYIDRFTASYNWTEVNFGSIWLRPWFYVFANGAVTDQLFGGLTFVTAGSWIQVPPAYFSLAQDNLFVGSTQYAGSPIGQSIYAKRSGPILRVHPDTSLQPDYAPCMGPKATCNLPEEGIGLWRGSLQPKRLLNIYDGPAHAEGNTFLNVGAWTCDPQPCALLTPDQCRQKLPLVPDSSGDREFDCGIYAATQQPSPMAANKTAIDPVVDYHRAVVIDAAIGWKQPNGFFYPPAFGHGAASFLAKVPSLPGQMGALNGLNQCFVPGGNPAIVPGDCRHNAMDRTQPYIEGNLISPLAPPTFFLPRPVAQGDPKFQTTPNDFQTILLDIDGSLTGAQGKLGAQTGMPTTSVSRNHFFDAPAQDDECLSYGVQTSPYTFATTSMGKLAASPLVAPTGIVQPAGTPWEITPMVPIYRQWISESDRAAGNPPCGDVCLEGEPWRYGCARASFMMGASIGQAFHLTMSIPEGSNQAGALYYLDTNAANQKPDCITAKTGVSLPATFSPNDQFVVYNLFARPDTEISYSIYVGSSVTDVAAIAGAFVRVDPHKHLLGTSELSSMVTLDCDPSSGTGWCSTGSYAKVENGILTVTLDHSVLAGDFRVAKRKSYDRCMPRDTCYFKDDHCEPCTTDPSQCTNKLIADADLGPLSRAPEGGSNPLKSVCDWATRSSGTVTGAPTERVFVDCPHGGCLGFAFKLPSDFAPKPYHQVNPPTLPVEAPTCFTESKWSGNLLQSTMENGALKDPLCGAARQPQPADFCVAP